MVGRSEIVGYDHLGVRTVFENSVVSIYDAMPRSPSQRNKTRISLSRRRKRISVPLKLYTGKVF